MPTKHCCYRGCSSDTRYKDRPYMQGVSFVRFPQPYIDYFTCVKWVEACGRPTAGNRAFTIDKVNKHTYMCTKHFIGGKGPTCDYPHPIPAVTSSVEVETLKRRKTHQNGEHVHDVEANRNPKGQGKKARNISTVSLSVSSVSGKMGDSDTNASLPCSSATPVKIGSQSDTNALDTPKFIRCILTNVPEMKKLTEKPNDTQCPPTGLWPTGYSFKGGGARVVWEAGLPTEKECSEEVTAGRTLEGAAGPERILFVMKEDFSSERPTSPGRQKLNVISSGQPANPGKLELNVIGSEQPKSPGILELLEVPKKRACDIKPVFLTKVASKPKLDCTCDLDYENNCSLDSAEKFRIELNPEWQPEDDNNKEDVPLAEKSRESNTLTSSERDLEILSDDDAAHMQERYLGRSVDPKTTPVASATNCTRVRPPSKHGGQKTVPASSVENNFAAQPLAKIKVERSSLDAKEEMFCTRMSPEGSDQQAVFTAPAGSAASACRAVPAGHADAIISTSAADASKENFTAGQFSVKHEGQKVYTFVSGCVRTPSIVPFLAPPLHTHVGQQFLFVNIGNYQRVQSFTGQSSGPCNGQNLVLMPAATAGNGGITIGQKILLLNPKVGEKKPIRQISSAITGLRRMLLTRAVQEKSHSGGRSAQGTVSVGQTMVLNPGVTQKAPTGQILAEGSGREMISLTTCDKEILSSSKSPEDHCNLKVSSVHKAAENFSMCSSQLISLLNADVGEKYFTVKTLSVCGGGGKRISFRPSGEKKLSPDTLSGGLCKQKLCTAVIGENSKVSHGQMTSLLHTIVTGQVVPAKKGVSV